MISNPAEPLSPDIKANPARVCVTLLAACYPRRSISCYQPSSSSSSSNSDRPARIFSLNEPANFEAVLRLAQPAHAAHSCMPACLPGWLAWLGLAILLELARLLAMQHQEMERDEEDGEKETESIYSMADVPLQETIFQAKRMAAVLWVDRVLIEREFN